MATRSAPVPVHQRQQGDRAVRQGLPVRRSCSSLTFPDRGLGVVGVDYAAVPAASIRPGSPVRRGELARRCCARHLNYAAEVFWPAIGLNCNACHVNNSWQKDRSTIGSVVAKPIDPGDAEGRHQSARLGSHHAAGGDLLVVPRLLEGDRSHGRRRPGPSSARPRRRSRSRRRNCASTATGPAGCSLWMPCTSNETATRAARRSENS